MREVFQQALAAHRAGDYAAAEQGYLAVRQYRNALQNLAALYNELGRHAEAEAALRQLLADYPDFAPARHSLSMTLLATRRYAEGWPLFEARRPVLQLAEPRGGPAEWDGGPLAGRRLAVIAEQGFGDLILFARYLPLLRDRGAEFAVVAPAAIAPLFEAAGYATAPPVISPAALAAFDAWVLAGSLPLRLGATAPPPPWRLPLATGSGGGVGVVATGNPGQVHDAYRSLPPDAAERLLRHGRDLQPAATGARDFLETARIVAGLDLVITVDSAMAHLAAALGKPVWVLLARVGPDWRWNDRLGSDWYPRTRIFNQAELRDWGPVLDEVERRLAGEGAALA